MVIRHHRFPYSPPFSARVYFSRVAEQLRAAAKKSENGKITAEGQKELGVVLEEMTAVRKMIERHKGIIQRVMKITIHKNEAKAYERLDAALDSVTHYDSPIS